MATHSSTLAQRIPWTEEPGGLLSMGSQSRTQLKRLSTSCRRKWQPIPVFLPGESQGQKSLVGCHLWGRTELDTTEATQQQQQREHWDELYLFELMFSLSSDIKPEVELMDHILVLFIFGVFEDSPYCFHSGRTNLRSHQQFTRVPFSVYTHQHLFFVVLMIATLCNPVDCSLPGFSVHGILQARILEWVASRGSS